MFFEKLFHIASLFSFSALKYFKDCVSSVKWLPVSIELGRNEGKKDEKMQDIQMGNMIEPGTLYGFQAKLVCPHH